MWATRAIFLNDISELMHSYNLAVTECHRRLRNGASPEQVPWIEGFIDYVENVGHPDPAQYIVSMSEDGDLLSQWRGYGDHAVGLEWEKLSELTSAWRLVKCLYDPKEQRNLISVAVDRALWELGAGHWDATGADPADRGSLGVGEQVRKLAPVLKHEAFSEEREWRLVNELVNPFPVEKVRRGARSLIGYTTIPLRPGTVREIVIGPGPYGDVKQAGASALAQLLPNSGWSVSQSNIPYLP